MKKVNNNNKTSPLWGMAAHYCFPAAFPSRCKFGDVNNFEERQYAGQRPKLCTPQLRHIIKT